MQWGMGRRPRVDHAGMPGLMCLLHLTVRTVALAAVALATVPASADERLLAQPPAGWERTYAINLPAFRLVEFEPPTDAASSPGAWRERLSFEASALAPDADPLHLFAALDAEQRELCSGYRSDTVFAGLEAGYPTVIKLLTCPRSPRADGQILLVKVIQGEAFMYTLTRTWRVPAFADGQAPLDPAAVGAWSLQLRRFRLCSTDVPADSERACPTAASGDAKG